MTRPGGKAIACISGLLLCFVFIIPGSAQNRNQVSVNSFYEQQYLPLVFYNKFPDSTEIIYYLEMANKLLASHPDSAQQMVFRCLEQSRRLHFSSGIAISLNAIGVIKLNGGSFEEAVRYIQKAIPYLKNSKHKNQVYKCYCNIGASLMNEGKYEAALENFYRALELIGKNNHAVVYTDSIAIYSNIGLLWTNLDEVSQALNNIAIAQRIASRKSDSAWLGELFVEQGIVSEGQDSALSRQCYLKALQISRSNNLPELTISALNSLSLLYIREDMPKQALACAKEAESILKQYPGAYTSRRFIAAYAAGLSYLDLGDYSKAKQILIPAFEKASALHFRMLASMENNVALLYARTGDYRKAFEHMMHYAGERDTLLQQEKAKTLGIWMKSWTGEKNKAMLAQRLEITKQKNQLQNKNVLIRSTILGSCMLLILLFVLMRNYRNRQRLQQSLMLQLQQEQQISQLKAQVRGEELERNRIAQELHDGIASQLWAIKLNVDSMQQQYTWGKLQGQDLKMIYQQLDDTTQEVRKTAHNLMPDLLLQEGLATALASLCERTRRQTGLEVDFFEYGSIPRLDPEIELSLYRMIQELIQNVMKHARDATQLLVQLSCNELILNLTVEDNGAGIADQDGEGIGLQFIHKRVKAMYGQMDLQSTPGEGTAVYLEFDVRQLLTTG